MTYLVIVFTFLVAFSGTFDTVDASCCGCCGCCCPCCCCKPIVIKLPPPPTKICPCCCCCKPCCCCCCKPCCCCCCRPCCCCCPCCCGGGGGRKKRDVVDIADKKFSDLFLPQDDAISIPQSLCQCNQCNQRGPSPTPCNNQFAFPPQQQQQPIASPLCGTSNGCNGFSSGNLMGNVNGMPNRNGLSPLHQIPIGHNQMNSFHANAGGFGSNIMNNNPMMGINEPINLMDGCRSDCMNGGNGCNGMGCNGNNNRCHPGECMMCNGCEQFGGNVNGCLKRRKRSNIFADIAAKTISRRKNRSVKNTSGTEQFNSGMESASAKRKKEVKNLNQKKHSRHNKLKPVMRRKIKTARNGKANSH